MSRSRTRTALLLCLIGLAASLALATGATVIDGPADTLADDRVAIQPADGPNGEYAYLDGDDELVIDVSPTNPNLDGEFEGVNVNSRTAFRDVFTVTYTADELAHVWIEHDVDGLSFVVSDDSDEGYRSIESEEHNVTLGPNATASVGVVVDTTDEDAVPGTLSESAFGIHAHVADPATEPSDFGGESDETGSTGPVTTVTAPSPSERVFVAENVDDGDTVRFDAGEMELAGAAVSLDRLDLLGASTRSYELEAAGSPDAFADAGPLEADDDPRPLAYLALAYDLDANDVEGLRLLFSAEPAYLDDTAVAPGDVTLYRLAADGEWAELDADGVDERVVELRGSPADRDHFSATSEGLSVFAVAAHVPRIHATGASLPDGSVDAGEETVVDVDVENRGGAAGERSLTLAADGEAIATRAVRLDPDASTTVSFPVTMADPGVYELTVEGLGAGDDALAAGTVAIGSPDAGDGAGTGSEADVTETPEDAGNAGEGGGANGDAAGSADTSTPTDEPGGLGLSGVAGLVLLLVVVTVAVPVVRRIGGS